MRCIEVSSHQMNFESAYAPALYFSFFFVMLVFVSALELVFVMVVVLLYTDGKTTEILI